MPESSTLNLDGLDPLFHHKVRLGACALLANAQELSFANLKENLDATDGNLGAQMRKLEDSGYVESRKQFISRKPVTTYELTEDGYIALEKHLATIRDLIRSTKSTNR